MAEQTSIKEMIRMIDDVIGGSLEFTLWKPTGSENFRLEVKSLDTGFYEVGQIDIELTKREATVIRERMPIDIQHTLNDLPFCVLRIISEKSVDFRKYVARELKP